jgi:hypothetical protein
MKALYERTTDRDLASLELPDDVLFDRLTDEYAA